MKTPGNRTVPLIIILVIAMISSCKKNPVGPQVTPNVQLSVDYVTCTEVWLKIGFTDSPDGGDYRITRDGATVLTGTFSGGSTIIYDTTAQAKKNYTYTAYWLSSGQVKQISPSLSVTTLDSTSHDYNWRVFYFGGAASSYLMDVSIVSDTNIWAGGAIYEFDSTGVVDPYIYNAAHWNGKSWEERRVYISGTLGLSPILAIYALNATDVWTGGTEPLHWNGTNWIRYDLTGITRGHAQKIWGTDSSNIFMVQDINGSIVHYDGRAWQEIPRVTMLPIQDILGWIDPQSDNENVVALASDQSADVGVAVLQVNNASAVPLNNSGLPPVVRSIWSADGKLYYVCGDGIYRSRSLDSGWQKNTFQTPNFTERVRGNSAVDFFVVGDFGFIGHYNGSTFREYDGQELPRFTGIYGSVDVRGGTVVAVGASIDGRAIAVIGHR
jgi:hypothetical protein